MTQMGLDYQKHLEQSRHNRATEEVESRKAGASEVQANANAYLSTFEPRRVAATESQADASQKHAQAALKQADTQAYVSSFEPRKVAATERQAEASLSQANTAQARYNLDSQYREREQTVAERNAAAQEARNEIQEIANFLKSAPRTIAAGYAGQGLGSSEFMTAISSAIDRMYELVNKLF